MIDPIAYISLAFAVAFPLFQWKYKILPGWLLDLGIGLSCIIFGIGVSPIVGKYFLINDLNHTQMETGARRRPASAKLLELYASAGPLLDFSISGTNGAPVTDSEMQNFRAKAHSWEVDAGGWLDKNLGPAAQSRFLDVGSCITDSHVRGGIWVDSDVQTTTRLLCLRKNLSNLIETGAYDQ